MNLTVKYLGNVENWCNISFDSYDANPLYYAENVYFNGELITNLVIPDTVTEIKPYAFSGYTSLESVTVSEGVKSIGERAFSWCTKLTDLTIGNGVKSIGEGAFYECTNLAELTVPSTVPFESVGVNAFEKTQLVFDVEYPTEEEIDIPIVRPPWGPIKGEDFIIDSDDLIDLNGV